MRLLPSLEELSLTTGSPPKQLSTDEERTWTEAFALPGTVTARKLSFLQLLACEPDKPYGAPGAVKVGDLQTFFSSLEAPRLCKLNLFQVASQQGDWELGQVLLRFPSLQQIVA